VQQIKKRYLYLSINRAHHLILLPQTSALSDPVGLNQGAVMHLSSIGLQNAYAEQMRVIYILRNIHDSQGNSISTIIDDQEKKANETLRQLGLFWF
jgi:hypothetical protein